MKKTNSSLAFHKKRLLAKKGETNFETCSKLVSETNFANETKTAFFAAKINATSRTSRPENVLLLVSIFEQLSSKRKMKRNGFSTKTKRNEMLDNREERERMRGSDDQGKNQLGEKEKRKFLDSIQQSAPPKYNAINFQKIEDQLKPPQKEKQMACRRAENWNGTIFSPQKRKAEFTRSTSTKGWELRNQGSKEVIKTVRIPK